MPLISGTVPSLINGVSQQPATLRMPTQGEAQINGLSHIARGLEKRPCTEHISKIPEITSDNSNDVFIHTIRRSEDEAYALVIKGGVSASDVKMKLIDLTGFATGTAGSEVFIRSQDEGSTVITASSALHADVKNYLSGFADPATNVVDSFTPNKLSATTIADFSFILNRQKKVKKVTTGGDDVATHKTSNYQGLVYIKTGDYAADYKEKVSVYSDKDMTTLDTSFGSDGVKEIQFRTPDNKTQSRTGSTANNNVSINNQNAVVISNIAHVLWKGNVSADSDLTACTLTEPSSGSGTGTAKIVDSTGADYDGDKGVITKGTYSGDSGGIMSLGGPFEITGMSGTKTASTNKISNITTTNLAVGQYITGTDIAANSFITAIDTHGSSNNGTITVTSVTTDGSISNIAVSRGYFEVGESIIYLESTKPFRLEVTDGKGDNYAKAINGSDEVPKFSDLPASKVPDSFTARISGDKSTGQDDYYVKWNRSVWKESYRPKYPLDNDEDSRKSIDNKTMPMQLFKSFGNVGSGVSSMDKIYFICKPVDWSSRTVGDDTTNPFPSFANFDDSTDPNGLYTINDIFFHRNRLGFISDENVILSEAAGYFNFFANTVLSVLDTSIIDVAVSNNQVAILKSAIPFQENLLLFSDLQQFKLTSDQFLTPTSVTVDVATNFETSTDAKPVAAGKTIFFPFQRGAFSGLREYMIDIASETNDANEITAHVPEYIEGTVKKMAVSSNEEVLFCLSDTDRRELAVYKYYYSDQEKLQSAWSRWRFDAEIVDMEFIGSIAFILFRRGTTIYLEKLNLSVDNATKIMDDQIGVRLDRRVRLRTENTDFDTLAEYYTDVHHDKVASEPIKAMGFKDEAGVVSFGSQQGNFITIDAGYKSDGTGGILNKPRVGQTFTSGHDATITYTVLASDEIDVAKGHLFEYSPTVADASSGHISALTITNAGSGYSGNGTLSGTGGGGSSFAGTYTVTDGAITSVTITNNGSGYTSVPTITISGSTSGTSAVITATVNKKWEANKDHVNVTQTSTSGSGTNVKFNINTDALGNPTFRFADPGSGYALNDTITVTDPGITSITAVVTISNQVRIQITPSIAEDAPIPNDTTLTFNERDAVYVVETGEKILSSNSAGILTAGTDYSKTKGNKTPDIFVGIPYEFEYEFSEQFVKAGDDSINSGRLQMRNFEISYDKTGFFEVEVSPFPYDDRLRSISNRKFTGNKVGNTFLGRIDLATGVFRVPVYCSSKDVKITVKSDSWLPLALQSADWEAMQVLRNQRV